MKTIWTVITLCLFTFSFKATQDTLSNRDIKILLGETWKGKLTYLDDKTGKEEVIPVELSIEQPDPIKARYIFNYTYPGEKQSNKKETFALNKDGTHINKELILKKTMLANKTMMVITERSGKDNGKKALLRYTYLLGEKHFSVKQQVIYQDKSKALVRNTYRFER